MKRYFRLLIFLFLPFAFGSAQSVSVHGLQALTAPGSGIYAFPQISGDGSKVFFTTPNHKGLYMMDLKRGEEKIRLCEEPGAGYQPLINPDGSEVIYRSYTLDKGRRFYSLIKIFTNTKQTTILEKHVRTLSVAQAVNQNSLGYVRNGAFQEEAEAESLDKYVSGKNRPIVLIENKKIALYLSGQKKILQPAGPGSYIWPEISPDGKKLLFKKLGDACYVSDFEGTIISSLGNINAPHWSPDGKWVVYMADKDNGFRLTASEIHIKSIDGGKDLTLTHTADVIELYPRWGRDNKTIVFCTARGQIYLMHLKWEQ